MIITDDPCIETPILTDKPYIETPPDDTVLIHYLHINQLLSILNFKYITFSSIPCYKDKLEASLSLPSYISVINHSLLEDNTPVKKDIFYQQRQQADRNLSPLNSLNFERNSLRDLEDTIEIFDRKIDTFAWLIYSFVRHFMFAHCWSVADAESILMWDRYGKLDSTVAIKTTIRRIKNAFTLSEAPIYPMYIGKIQYKDYDTEHITGYDGYANKNLSDPNIIEELFYQPMFHKQKVYQEEKEVRIIISYEQFVKNRLGDAYLSNIPYYDKHWGFSKMDPDPYGGFGDDGLYFQTGQKENVSMGRICKQSVDINELIENIIISPYAKSFVHKVLQHTAHRYGLDFEKVVNSSIAIR